MKYLDRHAGVIYAAGVGLLVLLFSTMFVRSNRKVKPVTAQTRAEIRTSEAVIRKWPKAARVEAAAMIAKYGAPNRSTKGALVWIHNGPWQRTVVYDPRVLGKGSKGFIEQTIGYKVPVEKEKDLKRFDARLAVNEIQRQLSVRSESETTNFLVVNIADEIITNARGVKGARDFYSKTVRLSKAGKSSPYLDRFLFPIRDGKRSKEPMGIDFKWMMIP